MSEVINDGSAVDVEASSINEINPNENDGKTVSYDSYARLLNQRKTDQAKLRTANEQLAEIDANKTAKAEADLKEQNKWQELAEQKETEANEYKQKFINVENSIVRAEKINAFENGLGEKLAHASFVNHINVDAIALTDDGNIEVDSLNAEINRFRAEYGGTLTVKTNIPTLPSNAPNESVPKGIEAMSSAERQAMRKLLLKK